MIEVFKTNVHLPEEAVRLVGLLQHHFPDGRINFDLDDCDRILRVEKPNLHPQHIIQLIEGEGFECVALE